MHYEHTHTVPPVCAHHVVFCFLYINQSSLLDMTLWDYSTTPFLKQNQGGIWRKKLVYILFGSINLFSMDE